MVSSLLSFFVASLVETNILPEENTALTSPPAIVRLAGFDLDSITQKHPIPVKDSKYISPIIAAKGSIGIDFNTGTVLYEKNAHKRLSIASITKLMTILIILEENNLDETVTVTANAASTGGSTMFLRQGEEIGVKELLLGALVQSANDSAVALAEHNAGSVQKFVEKMNQKALQLGLVNTHFANPMGLDNPDNYSSAFDVAKIARYIYQKQFIKNAAVLRELDVYSVDKKYKHELKSTNDLLDSFLHVKGLKTGHTDGAGLCLVTVAEDDSGNEVVTVVLNSPARFTESKILIDWLFRAYNW